jgi:hypothetical protein
MPSGVVHRIRFVPLILGREAVERGKASQGPSRTKPPPTAGGGLFPKCGSLAAGSIRPYASICIRVPLLAFFGLTLVLAAAPATSQQHTPEAKAQTIKDMLVALCLARGSGIIISAKGDLELRSKIKDILTENLDAGTKFSKQTWEGIIGGISKDMTAVQSEQSTEARKCMEEYGFNLVSKALANP